ncbi:hypothetical protein [Geobacter sp. SVR]|uniref:hypothetical protein n=1 Tax=Geobacter sp. SVR TaxID=2495594 RepID=UPI00143EFB38|nr:hypothetical protein [Geobacter sp. SVR]BCS54023.1 hypothetical protein GSVR_23310 [Geobacter sp. SVR]GCF86196.1 hypothetical protein GSbR_27960 [Geobacter sp. SVR]
MWGMGIGSILLLAVSAALSCCEVGASSERSADQPGASIATDVSSGSRQGNDAFGVLPAKPATAGIR